MRTKKMRTKGSGRISLVMGFWSLRDSPSSALGCSVFSIAASSGPKIEPPQDSTRRRARRVLVRVSTGFFVMCPFGKAFVVPIL